MKKSKIDKKEYIKLYNQNLNDREIAEIMNKPHTTISYYRRVILKLPTLWEKIEISKDQLEVLAGTILGDSSILYVHEKCRFPKISFSHSKKQHKYFTHKYKQLESLMSSYRERDYNYEQEIRGKKFKSGKTIYGIGRNLKCLIKIREIFYPDGVKIIPIDYLQKNFTEKSLAFLFMDDGCKNGKTINLNLQCFKRDNLLEFIDFLKNKFDLDFTLKKDKTLYLRHRSIDKFKNLVSPYIIDSMKYKLMSS